VTADDNIFIDNISSQKRKDVMSISLSSRISKTGENIFLILMVWAKPEK